METYFLQNLQKIGLRDQQTRFKTFKLKVNINSMHFKFPRLTNLPEFHRIFITVLIFSDFCFYKSLASVKAKNNYYLFEKSK